MSDLPAPISEKIWKEKYRLEDEESFDHTASRVATAIFSGKKEFFSLIEAISRFEFLPAGRVLAGAGSGRNVTLMNCYVTCAINDSMEGIMAALTDGALTLRTGGGIGMDFSTLRPRGAKVRGVAAESSGPIPFMDMWDAMSSTVMSAGHRRGAMMAVLRIDHPDIEEFIEAKRDGRRWRNFNVSVGITNEFIEAVNHQRDFRLWFNNVVYKTVRATELWEKLMRATYETSEPGVIFIDRVNERNNLKGVEEIAATNPCGEQPLPPNGACCLGSINLYPFVENPFTKEAFFDLDRFYVVVELAVTALDRVLDVTRYPLPAQREEAMTKRRIGLGVTGLADALAALGLVYGSTQAVDWTDNLMRSMMDAAYARSARLADELGAYPLFDLERFKETYTWNNLLSEAVKLMIEDSGLRNSHLISIAPTGTISLLAGNVSSGIEPIFALEIKRTVKYAEGDRIEFIRDRAYEDWLDLVAGKADSSVLYLAEGMEGKVPEIFVTADELSWRAHVDMQAAAQRWCDSSVSKTINLPQSLSFEDFKEVYRYAYEKGCKGCTTYRYSEARGSVLEKVEGPASDKAAPINEKVKESEKSVSAGAVLQQESVSAYPQAARLLDRPQALSGKTYDLHPPNQDHSLYATINDGPDGLPVEVFFVSKDPNGYAWRTALSRLITAILRAGVPGGPNIIIKELEAVWDPHGGFWSGGKYYQSLLAMVGNQLHSHYMECIDRKTNASLQSKPKKVKEPRFIACPRCGERDMLMKEGCRTCRACDYSTCS